MLLLFYANEMQKFCTVQGGKSSNNLLKNIINVIKTVQLSEYGPRGLIFTKTANPGRTRTGHCHGDYPLTWLTRWNVMDGFTHFMHTILTKVVPDNLKACLRFV